MKIGNIIYAMGGHNGQERMRSCEMYDAEHDTWTRFKDMNIVRSDASAAVHDGQIYIAGGLNNMIIENTVECYDPTTDTWTFITSMLSPRSSLSLVCYHNSLYAIGGNNGIER